VKNDSLEVPSGVEGIVIDTQKFSRRMSLSEDERKAFEKELKEAEKRRQRAIAEPSALIERDGKGRSAAS
jgi:DNA-directed RNA polymerase subunit beta